MNSPESPDGTTSGLVEDSFLSFFRDSIERIRPYNPDLSAHLQQLFDKWKQV